MSEGLLQLLARSEAHGSSVPLSLSLKVSSTLSTSGINSVSFFIIKDFTNNFQDHQSPVVVVNMDSESGPGPLLIDTNGVCVLCFRDTTTATEDNDENEDREGVHHHHPTSFRPIMRYLNISVSQLTNLPVDPSSLLDPMIVREVDNKADVMVTPCETCSRVINQLSELVKEFAMIRMRIDNFVRMLRDRVAEAEGDAALKKKFYTRVLQAKGGYGLFSASHAEILRKETRNKCDLKLKESVPKVALQKLSVVPLQKLSVVPASDRTSSAINLTSQLQQEENPSRRQAPRLRLGVITTSAAGSQRESRNNVKESKGLAEVAEGPSNDRPTSSRIRLPPAQRATMPSKSRDHGSPRSTGNTQLKTPHVCNTCGKCYKKKPFLASHILTHHPEVKPYGCEYCVMAFAEWSNLQSHIVTVHRRQYLGKFLPPGYAVNEEHIKKTLNLMIGKRRETGEFPHRLPCPISSCKTRNIIRLNEMRIHILCNHADAIVAKIKDSGLGLTNRVNGIDGPSSPSPTVVDIADTSGELEESPVPTRATRQRKRPRPPPISPIAEFTDSEDEYATSSPNQMSNSKGSAVSESLTTRKQTNPSISIQDESSGDESPFLAPVTRQRKRRPARILDDTSCESDNETSRTTPNVSRSKLTSRTSRSSNRRNQTINPRGQSGATISGMQNEDSDSDNGSCLPTTQPRLTANGSTSVINETPFNSASIIRTSRSLKPSNQTNPTGDPSLASFGSFGIPSEQTGSPNAYEPTPALRSPNTSNQTSIPKGRGYPSETNNTQCGVTGSGLQNKNTPSSPGFIRRKVERRIITMNATAFYEQTGSPSRLDETPFHSTGIEDSASIIRAASRSRSLKPNNPTIPTGDPRQSNKTQCGATGSGLQDTSQNRFRVPSRPGLTERMKITIKPPALAEETGSPSRYDVTPFHSTSRSPRSSPSSEASGGGGGSTSPDERASRSPPRSVRDDIVRIYEKLTSPTIATFATSTTKLVKASKAQPGGGRRIERRKITMKPPALAEETGSPSRYDVTPFHSTGIDSRIEVHD